MRVVFGDLDDMLCELHDKLIKEIRVSSLYDQTQGGEIGLPVMRAYVRVDALLLTQGTISGGVPLMYARYERVVYAGVPGFWGHEQKDIVKDVVKARERIIETIKSRAAFTVRAGFFEEA